MKTQTVAKGIVLALGLAGGFAVGFVPERNVGSAVDGGAEGREERINDAAQINDAVQEESEDAEEEEEGFCRPPPESLAENIRREVEEVVDYIFVFLNDRVLEEPLNLKPKAVCTDDVVQEIALEVFAKKNERRLLRREILEGIDIDGLSDEERKMHLRYMDAEGDNALINRLLLKADEEFDLQDENLRGLMRAAKERLHEGNWWYGRDVYENPDPESERRRLEKYRDNLAADLNPGDIDWMGWNSKKMLRQMGRSERALVVRAFVKKMGYEGDEMAMVQDAICRVYEITSSFDWFDYRFKQEARDEVRRELDGEDRK